MATARKVKRIQKKHLQNKQLQERRLPQKQLRQELLKEKRLKQRQIQQNQLRTLSVEYRGLQTIQPDPRNARTHSHKQISGVADSIRRFGFTNPILIDENNRVIAGHARLEAAKIVGLPTVPVIQLDGLTEAERRALALADNKLGLNAGWNIELLKTELHFLDQVDGLDVAITGFDTVEIDNLIVRDPEASADAEDTAPLPERCAVSRQGDRWSLGRHVVVCGDAMDPTSFKSLLGAERVRMVFMDPPYNVRIQGHVSGLGKKRHREFVMASGEMSRDTFTDFLERTLINVADCCTNGAIILECMDWRHLPEVLAAGIKAKLALKNLIVWCKTNAGMGTFYRSQHELILAFKVGSAPHVNNFGLGGTGRYRSNVWTYPGCNTFGVTRRDELEAHPTPKPITMVADAIRDLSHRGDIVLDCFGGSGSTLMAAERTGRRARLMELDPLYVDVIIRRWEAATGAKAIHVATKQTFDQVAEARSASFPSGQHVKSDGGSYGRH
jgi:DNA modification methylase